MNTGTIIRLLMLALASFTASPGILAQGPLTPPGAPAPTMKTLDQVEARTPISSAPFTISQPGSYYLTANLTVSSGNAITIATNGVTLDLNGFAISSTAASAAGSGILLSAVSPRNITIVNGFIQGGVTNNGSGIYSGSGFGYGIFFSVNLPVNVRVKDVSVSGCLYYGIGLSTGASTVVEGCTVRTVGSYGINASMVKTSSAIDCGNSGIYGEQVSDCRGEAKGGGYGVYAIIAMNCYGTSGGNGDGVNANTAQNCYGSSSSGTGVSATTALNCVGISNSGTGMNADNASNCQGAASFSGSGVNATSAQSCVGSSFNGVGVNAITASNCQGIASGSGTGLYAGVTATGCYGSSNTGTGLIAFIANVSHGASTSGTALSTSHNVNSF